MGRLASKRFIEQVPLTFYRTLTGEGVNVKGTFTRHHLGLDPDTRTLVNTPNTQCTVSVLSLNEEGFESWNGDNDVNLLNCYVKASDVTGVEKTYKIVEIYPDDSIGLVVCALHKMGV
ncbi:MAG: hypothetical protein PF486_06095 [Prolixibacteraceae bacterium]|nr:hypothetical protein [Prolixibacteraceae bacterium]